MVLQLHIWEMILESKQLQSLHHQVVLESVIVKEYITLDGSGK